MEIKEFLDRLDVIYLQPDEYVVLRFPAESYTIKEIQYWFEHLREKFPQNTVVILPDDMSIDYLGKDMMLQMLDTIRNTILEDKL